MLIVSQFSFFLNLSSTLLGLPRPITNGFSRTLGLVSPRFYFTRLTTQIIFGLACVYFSTPLLADLYIQLRLIQIQRQLDRLNDLVERRTLAHGTNKRMLEKILAVKEDARRDMEMWMKSREELENILSFVLLDRELPHVPAVDMNVEFDPRKIWDEQDEEIASKFAALKQFRKEIEEKIDWVEQASDELNAFTTQEEKEMQRMQKSYSRFLKA